MKAVFSIVTAEEYALYGEVEPFTGWDITDLYLIDSFQQDGARYDVYHWDAAYHVDDPEKVSYAGGMSIDADLRVQGFVETTTFAVRTVQGEEEYRFLSWDIYLNEDEQSQSRDTVVNSFDEAAWGTD